MRADWAFRAAVDMPLRPGLGLELGTAVAVAITLGFFGGRPRRLIGPWRTSIARLSRSRSAMSNASIWSTGTVLMIALAHSCHAKFGASGREFCVMIWARILPVNQAHEIVAPSCNAIALTVCHNDVWEDQQWHRQLRQYQRDTTASRRT
jgi:hypothetical protein